MNLAAIHEAIAARIPERDCIVSGERRFSWRETTDRSRRLASIFREHGLGCHAERSSLANHESGQDHVALYLYNGHEYLEGMLGAIKARTASFNVNYRYVEEELLYLFENARTRAVVFHAAFAPRLARIRHALPDVRLWLQVPDASGEALLPGALDYERALASARPEAPVGLSPDDLYILYTGGTTGMPKGVLWRQEDIFYAAMAPRRAPADLDELLAGVSDRPAIRALPTPPFMHGAAQWVVFAIWNVGGTIVIQSDPTRLDPVDVWSTVERERVVALTIVGDAFGRPLLDELARREYRLDSLRRITSGGAILSAALKHEILERLPDVTLLDALGSSESGSQASQVSTAGQRVTSGDFEMSPDSCILSEDLSRVVLKESNEVGWLARRGHVPLGYYRDSEKTSRTFPVVDGVRYSVPGDRARWDDHGRLALLGRDSVTINTGGEKVFAEEVEHALKHHPDVYDAVVVGTPHPRWGQQVTAVVSLRDGRRPDERSLHDQAARHLAPYKLPKRFVFVERIERSPSGKPDYAWARETALAAPGSG